jgi:hypothetical protein
MGEDRLGDRIADADARIEALERILEDHLRLAADVRQLGFAGAAHILPSIRIVPPLRLRSRMIERPVVDLPQPDSPTSDSVSPWRRLEGNVLDSMNAAD